MADLMNLAAEPRDRNRTTRALRRDGVIPGVLYGNQYDSRSLQFDELDLRRLVSAVGMTRLIKLEIEGTGDTETILIREVQRDPVTERILHVDLYRIVAGQLMTSTVQLITEGEAPAIEEGGVVNQLLDELDIECMPEDLPESIIVDVSVLIDLDSVITIADLPIPEGVTVLHDHADAVARVVIPRAAVELEEAEEAAALEAALEEAEEEGEVVEGAGEEEAPIEEEIEE